MNDVFSAAKMRAIRIWNKSKSMACISKPIPIFPNGTVDQNFWDRNKMGIKDNV